MSHKRFEIKKLVKSKLLNNTLCKERVYTHNFITFDSDHDYPIIGMHITSEEKIEDIYPKGSTRQAEINFIIYNQLDLENLIDDNVSDTVANQIEEQIENIRSKEFEFKYIKTSYDAANSETINNNEFTVLTYSVNYVAAVKYDDPTN